VAVELDISEMNSTYSQIWTVLFPVGNRVVVVLWKYWCTSFNCAHTTVTPLHK